MAHHIACFEKLEGNTVHPVQHVDVLHGVHGVAFQFFEARDVVRHPLVQRIVQAYEARDT